MKKFFRSRTYVIVGVVAVVAFLGYRTFIRKPAIVFETVKAVRQNLEQTVEVTGEIKPASRIDLSFKASGALGIVNVSIGNEVKKGQILASLAFDDAHYAERNASASLAQARANLNARLAGETSQSIQVSIAAVLQAQAAYDKAVADLESSKRTTADAVSAASIDLQTAKNNLDNQDAIVTQNVRNSYDSAVTTLKSTLGSLETGLTDGDVISGVDNTAANQSYKNVLGFLDSGSVTRSQSSYQTAKAAKIKAEAAVDKLTSASTPEQIVAAATLDQSAITLVQTYLKDVQKVLSASLTNSYFTTADLAAKTTTINADLASVSTQSSAVLSAQQTIVGAGLTKTKTISELQDAYKTAQTALATAITNADVDVRTAETNVAIQKAALDSAKASLDLKKSPPRAVDVAALRALVDQAQAAYEKAKNDLQNVEIAAPVDGIVSDIVPSVGEQIPANSTVISMVGVQSYEIEAEVPEADITKIEVGQSASTTLDAYGDEVSFSGTVTAKDPAETRIQDAIYYKIHFMIDPAGHEIKPGMTANVTIITDYAADALVIPLRAVRTDSKTGEKMVRVLVGSTTETKIVELGLRGDDGFVQVTSGLTEGDAVVVGETTAGP